MNYIQKDRDLIWHPFTQMKDYAQRDHLLIVRGDGLFLEDVDGNKYYDTVSSWWTCTHGHNHPRLVKALRDQSEKLDHVIFSGMTHPSAIELADELVKIAPEGLAKVFFSDNGSTAVEVALKMSFQYWHHIGQKQKNTFMYLSGSYHGDTLGAVSIGGIELFHAIFKPLLFDAIQVPAPTGNSLDAARSALRELEIFLTAESNRICGLIIEPIVQAAGGMNMYHPAYLRGARALCDQFGIHLIADEVAVGFGRTGRMFGCDHAGIAPDLVCFSKALTGGMMPLSVTMATQVIYDAFYDDHTTMKTFFHGHSYTGHPLATAVAAENLRLFREDNVLARIEHLSEYLGHAVRTRWTSSNHVSNIRHIGMIAAFDLRKDAASDIPYTSDDRIGFEVYLRGLEEGLILRPLGDTIYYWLPYCVTTADIDEIITRTLRILDSLH